MSEPSERIRAALFKNIATRSPQSPAPVESASKLPTVAVSAENLELLLGSGKPKDPKLAPAVEVLLPMLGANDEERLRQARSGEPVVHTASEASVRTVLAPESTVIGVVVGAAVNADALNADMDVRETIPDVGSYVPAPDQATAEIVSRGMPEFILAQRAPEVVTIEENLERGAKESAATEITEVIVEPAKPAEKLPAVEIFVGPLPGETASSITREAAPGVVESPSKPESRTEPPAPESPRSVESSLPTNNIGSTLFAETPPPTEEETARRESRTQFLRWIAPGIILLLLAGGMTAYLLSSRQPKTPRLTPASTTPLPDATTPVKVPLHLNVELQTNGQINVRWDPSEDAVAKAREGRLVVTEQDQAARVMPLTRKQLGIGHFSYQPSSERMEFRLEVVDQTGAVTEESVLAMSPKAAASAGNAAPAKTPASPNTTATAPAGAVDHSNLPAVAKATVEQTSLPRGANAPVPAPVASGSAPAPNALTEDAPRARTAPRTFAPPARQQGAEDIRTIILEPPAIGGIALLSGIPTQEALNSFAAPASSAPTDFASPRQINVGGNMQAGLLVKRVTPEYPAVAKAARIQGRVRFSAIIGRDGRIQDLKPTGGPSILIPPASAAVKQWIYRPTLLNGQPVEVATQIEVNFTLAQ